MTEALERLPIWPELQASPGSLLLGTGVNRVQQGVCQIDARDDIKAIDCWLNEYQDSPQTHRLYQKEIERLLLWYSIEKQKCLSDLNRSDLLDYEAFLAAPNPVERWCGRKGTKRGSSAWQPFEKGLSLSSIHTARSVLKSLFQFLVAVNYWQTDPCCCPSHFKNGVGKLASG
jgi:site-specific recombinase XerD